MKLVETKCPNCGAALQVEKSSKKIKCEYCNSTFILDDENTINIKHMQVGQITEEQEYINAKTNLDKLKNYDEAYRIYLSLSKRYVDDPEVWIGLLRAYTKDFTHIVNMNSFKNTYTKYWNNYVALASSSDVNKYKSKFESYNNILDEKQIEKEEKKKKNREGLGTLLAGLLLLFTKPFTDFIKFLKKDRCYFLIILFGGWFGLHHYLRGNIKRGLLYTFTFGLLFVGYFKDCVNECEKYPDSKQVKYFNRFIMVFFALYVLVALEVDIISALLFLLAAILTPSFIWNKINFKNRYIRTLVPIILAILGMNIYSEKTVIPAGDYISTSEESKYYILHYEIDKYKLYESKDSKEYIKVECVSDGDLFQLKKDDEVLATFSYDFEKDEMCLLDEEDNCSVIYELKKEDE